MVTRRTSLGILASAFMPLPVCADDLEPEFLRPRLLAGEIPALAHRLPTVPRIVRLAEMHRLPGRHGGDIRMLIGGQKDIRLMTIYGYARLVGFDEKLNLQADILESFETIEDRVFTFRIRAGHKWSDGLPLTSEDFRYCWEDIYLNDEMTPAGIAPYLKSGGKAPVFDVIDGLTVRYSWDVPNSDFLPRIAAAQPLSLAVPSHYLKQFHAKYQSAEKLKELIQNNGVKKWSALHTRMGREYRPENPDLPTLQPWRNITAPPAEQFVFERNPFFHRADENGRQLPYVDRFILNISSSSLISAKTGAGESDLQGNALDFSDYTFLKEAEKRHPIKVELWKRTQGSRLALLPNLNFGDAVQIEIDRVLKRRRLGAVARAFGQDVEPRGAFGLDREHFGHGVVPALCPAGSLRLAWFDRKRRSRHVPPGTKAGLAFGVAQGGLAFGFAASGHGCSPLRNVEQGDQPAALKRSS